MNTTKRFRRVRLRTLARVPLAVVIVAAVGLPGAPPAAAAAGDISTFAGGPGEGPPTNVAQTPSQIAVVGTKLYMADRGESAALRVMDLTAGTERVVAGVGFRGFSGDGGAATSAALDTPSGVAVDANGNIFIADFSGARVRKVDPAGIITTYAGNGTSTRTGNVVGDGGPATAAQVQPWALALDGAGNLFISDSANNRVRRVDTNGTITTVAGGLTAGYNGDNQPASLALLSSPRQIAFDAAGNLFIADIYNHRVRRVDTAGTITTVAGAGVAGYSGDCGATVTTCPATAAELHDPTAVAVDTVGNLFIAEAYNQRVRKVSPTGDITTYAGSGPVGYERLDGTPHFGGDGGPATSALFNQPEGLALDAAGNLYIADTNNARLRKVDAALAPDGTRHITTLAGNGFVGFGGDGGPFASAQLDDPSALAKDRAGNLYIGDYGNCRVRRVDRSGIITTVAGRGCGPGGNWVFSGDGGPATSADLSYISGIVLDGAGNLYIADTQNQRIRRVDPAGIITTVVGTGVAGYNGDNQPGTSAQIKQPADLALDGSGNLYFTDQNNNRIRKLDPTGIITTVAGTGVYGYNGDNQPATSAQLKFPGGMTLDRDANIYFSDINNSRVRRVDHATGIITTVAGPGVADPLGNGGDGGKATDAYLEAPVGLLLDGAGTLFIADYQDARIRRVDAATQIITTAAGTGVRGFSGDGGPAIQAKVAAPLFMNVDDQGNLLFTDTWNNRIRKVANIAVPIPGRPEVQLRPVSVAFGDQNVATTSGARTATVTNTGTAALTITSATVAGAQAGDFAVGSDTCSSAILAPDASCSVSVAFTPAAGGARTASLEIVDNASGGPQHVALSGNGVAPPTPTPSLSISDATVAEGDAGATAPAAFSISLSGVSDQPVTATYATVNATATAPADYTATSGTVSFAPGETRKTVSVVVKGDNAYELKEKFKITLTAPTGATIADGVGLGFITNDDPVPTLAIADLSRPEGTSTTKSTFKLTVSLSAPSGLATTVAFATANGTATAGSDYTARSGTLTIAAGATTATFNVAVVADATPEANETFKVNLTNPTNATIADARAVATITNDD